MKKRASILAVAVLSLGLGLLAGCGNSEANLSQKTKESTTAAESNSAEKGETEEKDLGVVEEVTETIEDQINE